MVCTAGIDRQGDGGDQHPEQQSGAGLYAQGEPPDPQGRRLEPEGVYPVSGVCVPESGLHRRELLHGEGHPRCASVPRPGRPAPVHADLSGGRVDQAAGWRGEASGAYHGPADAGGRGQTWHRHPPALPQPDQEDRQAQPPRHRGVERVRGEADHPIIV